MLRQWHCQAEVQILNTARGTNIIPYPLVGLP